MLPRCGVNQAGCWYVYFSLLSVCWHGRMQAAMEILFLEAAMQVLDEFVPDFWQEPHFQSFFKSMQQ